ncbi:hypothetical protein BC829DRAFT_438693 [Chytridium lagenaria]|nr:hypothetical protein BC829DRAFT_438693 [Chytridium lagenaria]
MLSQVSPPRFDEVREKVQSLQSRVDTGDLDTFNGVSLLELKTHGLLSYITDLTLYCMLKVQGQRLVPPNQPPLPLIDRLIEHRVVLERTRPVEQKLKYQIDKLLRGVATSVYDRVNRGEDGMPAVAEETDALKFKPNPSNLVSAGAARDNSTSNDGIYRPPKVAPVPYEEKVKGGKASSLTQIDSRPEERTTIGTGAEDGERKSREEEEMDELQEREEATFTRFTTTKQQRKAEERKMRMGGGAGLRDEIEQYTLTFLICFRTLNAISSSIRSIDRAVAEDDLEKFGVGLNARRKRTAATIQDLDQRGGSKLKRSKVGGIEDVLSKAAGNVSTKGAFEKDVRRVTKPRKRNL